MARYKFLYCIVSNAAFTKDISPK